MSRYNTTNITKKDKNNKIMSYDTTIYEKVPERNDDFFVVTQEGDRLDALAFQFYRDPSMWWFIAQTNNLNSMNVEPGTRLRISVSTEFAKVK